MTTMLPLGVLSPFVLALLPAALPNGVSPRGLCRCAIFCAGLTLLIALGCALPAGANWLDAASPGWRADPLARTLPVLAALCWLLVSLRASQPGETARAGAARWRRWPIGAQLATAATMAICRADLLAVIPPLLGVLLLSTPRERVTARDRTAVLAALPPMATGVALLSGAMGIPVRWSSLHAGVGSGRTQLAGLALLLVPLLILSVAATLRPVLTDRTSLLRGLFRLLLMAAALAVAMRCRGFGPLAPALWVFGCGAIVLSLLLLPGCRSLSARLGLAVALQNGVILLAVAVGGAGGIAVAVMILGFLCLLLPLVLWFPLDASSTRLRAVAIAVMVGVPPFGPFAAGLVLLVRLSDTKPAVVVLLLPALAISAISVLGASRREAAQSPGGRLTAWSACVGVVVLAVLWLGLAMPATLSNWLLLLGETTP